jgi:hypothetical protein
MNIKESYYIYKYKNLTYRHVLDYDYRWGLDR